MPVPDSSPLIVPGRVLAGRYNLVTPLAKGGMAEVWEAVDEVLSRSVAVKLLAAHLAEDAVFVERFRREAISAARLSSPSIVATYDTGADAGTAYIVMELVRGRTVRQLVTGSGPLDPQLAVAIAIQIADALADAHRAGLIHRDIKPANVLICDDDSSGLRVKVTDFGIAKARAGAGIDLTQTGMVLGTPKYLSPEQIEGRADVDTRSDLYSLGVVLFEMLTGDVPFRGQNDMATALAHLQEGAPAVSSRRRGIQPALDALVASLLAKSPADRPPSALAARQALETVYRRGGWPSPAVGAGRGSGPGREGGGRPVADRTGREPVGRTPPSGSMRPDPARRRETGSTRLDRRRRPGSGSTDQEPSRPPPATGVASTAGVARVVGGAGSGRSAGGTGSGRAEGGADRPPPGRPGPASRRRSRRSDVRERMRRRPGRTAGTLVGVVVLAGVIVGALLLSGHRGPGRVGVAGSGGGVTATIESVSVFMDTTADPPDHPGETKYTYDGNPATAWETDVYSGPDARHFGGFYSGEGLAIELTGTHRLSSLVVTSPISAWNASAYVSTTAVPSGSPVSDWGTPTTSVTDAGSSVTLSLAGRTGRWVLLWLTELGPTAEASISELTVHTS